VGDIGGTHARFALVATADAGAGLSRPESLACRDFASIQDAIQAYLDRTNQGRWPRRGGLAVAGPVQDGAVTFTNLGWRFSEADLTGPSRLQEAHLMNDFVATALAAPALTASDLDWIGPVLAVKPGATLAVLGPGTGFGVAALVREGDREVVMGGEGGHIAFAPSFAPGDGLEAEIAALLAARHGRVSVERMLSGPGILDVYDALGQIKGRGAALFDPEAVTAAARAGDPLAVLTLEVFCAALGSVAGDFALAFGALGGVFIAGGVAPPLLDFLRAGAFRRRFEDKGRLSSYTQAIATQVIKHPYPNLLGAARRLAASPRARRV
jgi:glucokinase